MDQGMFYPVPERPDGDRARSIPAVNKGRGECPMGIGRPPLPLTKINWA